MIIICKNKVYLRKKIEEYRKKIHNYKRMIIKEKMIQILIKNKQLRNRECLNLEKILGKGNFGLVYKGLLTNQEENNVIEVAVKTVKNGKQ